MPQQERIDSYIDLAAIEKETKIFVDQLDMIISKMAQISKSAEAAGVNMTKASPKELQTSLQQTNKLMTDAVNAENKLTEATNNYQASTERLKKSIDPLARLNATLARTQAQNTAEGQKLVGQIEKERAELQSLSFERKKNLTQERSQIDFTRAFAQELNTASMNINEMQKELSRLNAMSFKGLNPEQITMVKARMADLTDAIGDFQTRVKVASTDAIPSVTNALSGLVGIAQGFTGTLAIFGIENKKLEQTMIGLISVSMALKEMQAMVEARTLQNAAATIKETAAKAKLTVQTWAQKKADESSMGITKSLFKLIAKNPYLSLAIAIAAVTTATVIYVRALMKANSANEGYKKLQGDIADIHKKAAESSAEQAGQVEVLANKIKQSAGNQKELSKYVNEWNTKYGKEYGASIDAGTFSLDQMAIALEKVRKGILDKAVAAAAEEKLTEFIKNNIDEYQRYIQQQKELNELKNIGNAEDNLTIDQMNQLNDAMGEVEKSGQRSGISIEERQRRIRDINSVSESFKTELQGLIDFNTTAQDAISGTLDATQTASKEASTVVNEQLKAIASIEGKYQQYLITMADFRDGTITASDAFSKLTDLYNSGVISIDEYIKSNDKLQESMLGVERSMINGKEQITGFGNAFPDKIKYTQSYIEQLSQSFKGLDKLLEEGQITPEEWAAGWEKLSKEAADKVAENTERMKEDLISVATESANALGAYVDLMQTRTQNEIDSIDAMRENDLASLQNQLDQGLILQNEYDAAVAGVEAQADARKKALAQKQAAREKAAASFSIALNTAKAIMSVWADPEALLAMKIIMSAIVGATGALQLANVAAQPLPAYKDGRTGGAAETAIVGEAGREIISDGRGNYFLTPNAPTLVDLPAGADVIPNKNIASFMAGQIIHSDLPDSMLGGKIDRLNDTLKNKEFLKLEITRSGMALIAQQGYSRQRYISQRLQK